MNSFKGLPLELRHKLHRLSLNEALKQGLITDVGDDEGNFLVEQEDEPGVYYAVIQGCHIRCSNKLIEQYTREEIMNVRGDLTFFNYTQNGEEHIRIGRPAYLKLGEPVVTLKHVEEVEVQVQETDAQIYNQSMPMHLDNLFETVKKEAEKKLRRVLSLCDKEVAKRFVGNFYCFYMRVGTEPLLHILPCTEFKIISGPNGSGISTFIEVFKVKNARGLEAEVTGHVCSDPFSEERGLLLGFRVHRGYAVYEVMPQYGVFDESGMEYVDLAIHVLHPKTNAVLSRFAIDFEGNRTAAQSDAANERAMFITKNNYRLIKYSGNAVNRMDDSTIVQLERTMYSTVYHR